jgi:hypothetical protein
MRLLHRDHLSPQILINPSLQYQCWNVSCHEIGMGHFSLKNKKKSEDNESRGRSRSAESFVFGLIRRGSSQQLSDSSSKITKQPLVINTTLANASTPPTPPPTPNESPSKENGSDNGATVPRTGRRASVPNIGSVFTRRGSIPTPPQSPRSGSPTKPPSLLSQRQKSFTSFFKTPRQRKLEQIREGKLPDLEVLPVLNKQLPSTPPSDDDAFPLAEILDPSSSTTYNPENRVKYNRWFVTRDSKKHHCRPPCQCTSTISF